MNVPHYRITWGDVVLLGAADATKTWYITQCIVMKTMVGVAFQVITSMLNPATFMTGNLNLVNIVKISLCFLYSFIYLSRKTIGKNSNTTKCKKCLPVLIPLIFITRLKPFIITDTTKFE